ncbi:MAG: glucose-6-phosphate dehydrogenase (NADP(+)) [Patescibacteria group bacterium]|nr:glucose-6-phosphate dehydrogenase (NADP(+)) [Patescibacteria group bacterium]
MHRPLTIVVFGTTGDLYQNKLATALFDLFSSGFLPAKFTILGFARKPLADLEFRKFSEAAIKKRGKKINKTKLVAFLKHLEYIQGDLNSIESFKNLRLKLASNDKKNGACSNKLFYLAVPPTFYRSIFQSISKTGLSVPCATKEGDKKCTWTRILVEKPFGQDIKEAENLDKMLGKLFDESQIFRIDHYLAKEAVQNILNFRFNNGIFEPLWNNKKIEKVRIVFHENNNVSNRGAFYDDLGALRDVGQNHMLQLLALIAMDNPAQMNKKEIHAARQMILENTKFRNVLVRGQYEGYLNEKDVKGDSNTETFFRLNVSINIPRWKGVCFELESGKALANGEVFIEVYFKNINAHLTFSISSNEGVTYDAYEKVLYDAILGDQTLFVSTKEIMSEWVLITDIIKKWQKIPLVIYKKGSKGEDI